MAIEFPCVHCGRLLKVEGAHAGLQAKCPECGGLMAIPSSSPASPTLAPLPPFANAPAAADPQNPYSSPQSSIAPPQQQLFAYPAGPVVPTQVTVSEVLDRAWALFKPQWVAYTGGAVIPAVITNVGSFALQFSVGGGQDGQNAVLFGVGMLVLQIVNAWLIAGQIDFFVTLARGGEADFGRIFRGGRYLGTLVAGGILSALLVALGFVLLIIPGIIVGLMLAMFPFFVVDRNAGVIEAMGLSRQVMAGNKFTLFLTWLTMMGLIVGLYIVGILTCGLGLLLLLPGAGYLFLIFVVFYLRSSGQMTADMAGLYYMGPGGQPAMPGSPFAPASPFGQA